jgi:hexosaminidase
MQLASILSLRRLFSFEVLVFSLLSGAAPGLPGQEAALDRRELTHNLLPVPASVEFQPGQLRLDTNFSVAVEGHTDARLDRAVQRMLGRLVARTGLTLARPRAKESAAVTLLVRASGPGMKVQGVEEDESYALEVTARRAALTAPTGVGVLRGLETLLQLVERDAAGSYLPLVRIQDRPRFPWRGLLIDVCRHWQPVEVIKRNLDAMAAVKMNVLHWHLSEDQGFRVESRRFPKLQELGSDGLYYTQDEIREIVAYARDRGIRVLPEFDMPGHSTAWFVGYPELASGPGPYAIERRYGVFDPAFDPSREATYRFLDRFIGEMTTLFPDAYWHIGGDENPGRQWNANPAIQAFMRKQGLKDAAALQAYFNQRLARILQKHGKRMVGWDEIMRDDLPKNTVVQSWRGQVSLDAGAKQGFSGILSAGYYLDAMTTAGAHYAVDPLPATSGLDAAQAARILGGEACMWGELITPDSIDSRIWPRTAAIAERLWSPREAKDVNDLYRRLAVVRVQLEETGAQHLTGPDRMLRRLAGTEAIEPLRELLRWVEPVSLGERQRTSRATQLTALSALGDIATPDVPARHDFAGLVSRALRDSPGREADRAALRAAFERWRALPEQLARLVQTAPQVHDADGVAADLAALGAAGEQALSYLAQGAAPPAEWSATQGPLLDQAARAKGLLRIAVVDAMRTLLMAAASGGRPASLVPELH